MIIKKIRGRSSGGESGGCVEETVGFGGLTCESAKFWFGPCSLAERNKETLPD